MVKQKPVYRCKNCGAQTSQWLGQCPGCREWNSLEECSLTAKKESAIRDKAKPLSAVGESQYYPFTTGIEAFDKILGGGLRQGASILLGGEPGIGKSTLLLQVCQAVAFRGQKALYASGEESLEQIRMRGERLGDLPPALMGISTINVEEVIQAIEQYQPGLVVADSVQTMASSEADGLPGNVTQTKAVANLLVETCRKAGSALVLVGHVTKDGTLAGPRMLEHMVDAVISLEGDRRQMFRLLRVYKNRFGPNDELLVFKMEQRGLILVPDPSTFFLEERDASLSGTALVMACDGQRPLLVEVQALVSRSFLGIPRRAALGFDVNRLHLLLAVMEKRLKLNFGQSDIYAKVGGGIKLQEPGLDLGIAAAVLSSYYDTPLPPKSVFWGEVDLNGQIRPVSLQKNRINQARILGYSPVFCAGIKNGMASVMDLQRELFRRK